MSLSYPKINEPCRCDDTRIVLSPMTQGNVARGLRDWMHMNLPAGLPIDAMVDAMVGVARGEIDVTSIAWQLFVDAALPEACKRAEDRNAGEKPSPALEKALRTMWTRPEGAEYRKQAEATAARIVGRR